MPTDNKSLTHLVVGLGEVGKALRTVLTEGGAVADGLDLQPDPELMRHGPIYDVLHVCIPCRVGALFVHDVKEYRRRHLKSGGLLIVHSSVPVGTTRELDAVHSPIRGVHPNLVGGLRTFVKYFGGPRADEAAALFEAVGVSTRVTPDSRNTEALKLWDTTYYGWAIILEKSVFDYCQRLGLDYELVYGDANRTYNAGYATLGMGHVVRPVLKHFPGKIGGHCVVPNAKLLADWIGDMITAFDEQLPIAHTENK